jgi:magnesium-transporting ATPase (P-type)
VDDSHVTVRRAFGSGIPAGKDEASWEPGPSPHLLPADAVHTALGTSPRGLSGPEADRRRREHGANELPRPRPRKLWREFAAQFTDLFAVVYGIGAETEFGRIFRLTETAPRQKTPLQRQVASMARRVAALAVVTGLCVFAARLRTGQPLVPTFVFALGVMVALVPEGLPATLSVSLAIGVRRMARRHALVKQLLAVEALGSTTVICTDETGTLTQAEMTVTLLWADGTPHEVSGVGYAPSARGRPHGGPRRRGHRRGRGQPRHQPPRQTAVRAERVVARVNDEANAWLFDGSWGATPRYPPPCRWSP